MTSAQRPAMVDAGGRENLELISRLNEEFDVVGAGAVKEALRDYTDPTIVLSVLGDLGRLVVESFHPELEIDLSGYPVAFAGASKLHGLGGWVELWRAWLEPYDRFAFRADGLEAIGDEVVHELHGEGRLRESGREVTWHQTHVWTLRDGRVVRFRIFPSREEALRAIG